MYICKISSEIEKRLAVQKKMNCNVHMNEQVIYATYDEKLNTVYEHVPCLMSCVFDVYMYGLSTFLVHLCTAEMCIWHLWILGIFGWKMVSQPAPPRWHCTPIPAIQRWNSWKYNFVEVSGHGLEIFQTWGFNLSFCLSTNAIHDQTWVFFIHMIVFVWISETIGVVWFSVSVRFSSFRCISNCCFYGEKMYLYTKKV